MQQLAAITTVNGALTVIQWIFLAYFLLVNGVVVALVIASAIDLRQSRLLTWRQANWRLLGSEVIPTVSLIAPAYNESVTVTESVRSLLTLSYPNLEVLLINDGSSDNTLEILKRDFELVEVHPLIQQRIATETVNQVYRSAAHPELVVIDKENGGKADALNVGLNAAAGDLVCAIDADTIVDPEALVRMVRPFITGSELLAAGGMIRVVNGCQTRAGRVVDEHAPRNFIAGIQAVEYMRAFLTGRLGWNRLGGNLVISGAFGLFRREEVIAVGGYLPSTVGEDMELVARLRIRARQRGETDRIEFIPDPVAWTEVPESLRVLGRQRDRWHRGLAEVLWQHRSVICNPRFGWLGMVIFPYFLFVELLAPVAELIGIGLLVLSLTLGAVDWEFAALFMAVAYGFSIVATLYAVVMEEWTTRAYGGLKDRLLLFGYALVEGFGYRQLTVIWRLRGLLNFVRGNSEWGEMSRSGFQATDELPIELTG